jgi:hypothetical protein
MVKRRSNAGQSLIANDRYVPVGWWKSGVKLVKYWSNTGQTLLVEVRRETGQAGTAAGRLAPRWITQTLVKQWSNNGQTMVKQWSNTGQIPGQIRQAAGRLAHADH